MPGNEDRILTDEVLGSLNSDLLKRVEKLETNGCASKWEYHFNQKPFVVIGAIVVVLGGASLGINSWIVDRIDKRHDVEIERLTKEHTAEIELLTKIHNKDLSQLKKECSFDLKKLKNSDACKTLAVVEKKSKPAVKSAVPPVKK